MEENELQAGRELDALIAEKVMGFTGGFDAVLEYEAIDGDFGPPHRETVRMYRARPKGGGYVCGNKAYLPSGERVRGDFYLPPRYSTDIAAAWMVAEHFRPEWEVQIQNHHLHTAEPMEGWAARIGYFEAYAPTPPLAICRAALKAVAQC